MPDPSVDRTSITNAIVSAAGRSTLPIRQAPTDKNRGTAFWFNDPVDAANGQEVRQYLVTADALTRCDLGELLLRAGLCEPALQTDILLLPGFAEVWKHLDRLGVAVLPTAFLHAHGERKGWRWTTDEITGRLAARDQDIAGIGAQPVPAFVLGHDVEGPLNDRPQTVVTGNVARSPDGVIHWDRETPDGCAGAPVFILGPTSDPEPSNAEPSGTRQSDTQSREVRQHEVQRSNGHQPDALRSLAARNGTRRGDFLRPGGSRVDGWRGGESAVGGTRPVSDARPLCIGLILPGPSHNPIATFDHIRPAVRHLVTTSPPPRRRRRGTP